MKYYLSSWFYPFRGEAKIRSIFSILALFAAYFAGFALGVVALVLLGALVVYAAKMLNTSMNEDSSDELCQYPEEARD